MPEENPFKTTDELASLLVDDRRLRCNDREMLVGYLRRTNYCRFAGYARQFQRDPAHGDVSFLGNAAAADIVEMVELDARLRHLLFRQLSAIEVGVRSVFAHELGRVHGGGAFYLDESSYLDFNGRPQAIVNGLLGDLSRSRLPLVGRYADSKVKGDDTASRARRYRNVPVWVAVEAASFGRISNMIGFLADAGPAKATAAALSVQWRDFGSVVHSLSVLRNVCCHHGQVWHRRLDIQCPVQKKLRPRNVAFDPKGAYAAIVVANHYRSRIDGDASVADEIDSLLESSDLFAEGIRNPKPR